MKPYLRSIVTALAIAAVVLTFTVQVLARSMPRVVGRPAVQETRDSRHEGVKAVHLTNDDGIVRVMAHSGGSVTVSARVRVYLLESGSEEEANRYAAALVRAAVSGDGLLEVVSEPDERPDGVDVVVDYSLYVPAGTDIEVANANGNIWVGKGCGRVTLLGRNADIEVKQPEGDVRAETTNGRINVVDAPRGATLKTVNGSVYVRMDAGMLEAETTNGAIVAHLRDRVEGCDLTSRNGGITVVLAEGCSALVDAQTSQGGIRSDIAVDVDGGGARQRRRLRGKIGDGRAGLKMETLNGNIWLARSR